ARRGDHGLPDLAPRHLRARRRRRGRGGVTVSSLRDVVRWEVMRNLRNKQFIIGMFVTPLIFVLFAAVPQVIDRLDSPRRYTYVVVDGIGALTFLEEQLAGSVTRVEGAPDAQAAADRVRSE